MATAPKRIAEGQESPSIHLSEKKERLLIALRERCDEFKAATNEQEASEAVRQMLAFGTHWITEYHRAECEIDSLACELLTYRPTRTTRPPAPILHDHCYVTTASSNWVCITTEERRIFQHQCWIAAGITQEHFVPGLKTLCGKKTLYPFHDRFGSGGWPRQHELCTECLAVKSPRELGINVVSESSQAKLNPKDFTPIQDSNGGYSIKSLSCGTGLKEVYGLCKRLNSCIFT